MFDATLNAWLQSWSSPGLTMAMNVISVVAYFPSAVAVAAAYAFGWRLRPGLVLLVALAMAALLTNVAKATVKEPRPFEVDARVRALGAFQPGVLDEDQRSRNRSDERYGFPSGHTAATTVLSVGLWWFVRRRSVAIIAVAWISLTALSRLYLGRHFAGDVLGGVAIGIVALWLAWRPMGLREIARGARAHAATLALTCAAAIVAIVTLAFGGLQAIDAGRFCGFATAGIVLVRTNRLSLDRSAIRRFLRVTIALVFVGCAVFWAPIGIDLDPVSRTIHFTVAAVLNAAVLLVPVAVVRPS